MTCACPTSPAQTETKKRDRKDHTEQRKLDSYIHVSQYVLLLLVLQVKNIINGQVGT